MKHGIGKSEKRIVQGFKLSLTWAGLAMFTATNAFPTQFFSESQELAPKSHMIGPDVSMEQTLRKQWKEEFASLERLSDPPSLDRHLEAVCFLLHYGNYKDIRRVQRYLRLLRESQPKRYFSTLEKIFKKINAYPPEVKKSVILGIAVVSLVSLTRFDEDDTTADAVTLALFNFQDSFESLLEKMLQKIRQEVSSLKNPAWKITLHSQREDYFKKRRLVEVLKNFKDQPWETLCKLPGEFPWNGEWLDLTSLPSRKDLTLGDGLRFYDLMDMNRSCFFRDHPPGMFEYVAETVGDILLRKITDTPAGPISFRLGTFGSAFGQEPASLVISVHRVLVQMGLPPDRIKWKVHVFDKQSSVYRHLEHNHIAYPENFIDGISREEKELFFRKTESGWIRSDFLNAHLHFHECDFFDPPKSSEDTKIALDFLVINNVLQYIRPEHAPDLLNKSSVAFESQIAAMIHFLRITMMAPDGKISIYSSAPIHAAVKQHLVPYRSGFYTLKSA